MATLGKLILNGGSYVTVRGSTQRPYGGGQDYAPARSWQIGVVLETSDQEGVLLAAMTGYPVAVTLPDGTQVARALVQPVGLPLPQRPVAVTLTITDIG